MPTGIPKSGKRKCSKRVERISVVCEVCGRQRVFTPSEFKRRTGRFCSRQCASKKQQRKKAQKLNVVCKTCGDTFQAWPSQAKKYCGRACWAKSVKTGFDVRKWREDNRERLRESSKSWRKANPEKASAIRRNYLARRRDNIARGHVDTAEIEKILAKKICVYCGKQGSVQIDHIDPLARGGEHELSNLIPACAECNRRKSARPVDEWLMEAHGVLGLARAIVFIERGEFPSALYQEHGAM
jgi:5-methylcytosine-specific restriction endonuclease McrA